MVDEIKKEIATYSDPEKIKAYKWFFKTGKGQYGEGDRFLGVTVPHSRAVAKKFKDADLSTVQSLLKSKFHEERLVALLILTYKFPKASDKEKEEITKFYLQNTKYINSWDLVDLSAHKILGYFIFNHPDTSFKGQTGNNLLSSLAKSGSLWERRIAIISTFYFIAQNSFDKSLQIAEVLLNDNEDLIHKAVGWMLREIGKRDQKAEEIFLKKYYKKMPRTMLRYSIEKFPEGLRKKYLEGSI